MKKQRSWRSSTIIKLGTLQTMQPINFRNQPVGCTGTIMYQIYGEQKAGNPPEDRRTSLRCNYFRYADVPFSYLHSSGQNGSRTLALIADISIEEFAKEMFKAGSNLKDKAPEEIFYQV